MAAQHRSPRGQANRCHASSRSRERAEKNPRLRPAKLVGLGEALSRLQSVGRLASVFRTRRGCQVGQAGTFRLEVLSVFLDCARKPLFINESTTPRVLPLVVLPPHCPPPPPSVASLLRVGTCCGDDGSFWSRGRFNPYQAARRRSPIRPPPARWLLGVHISPVPLPARQNRLSSQASNPIVTLSHSCQLSRVQ